MFGEILGWIALALFAVLLLALVSYRWDICRAYERIRVDGTVIHSPYGDIQYTQGGSGPPVLVIHGSGGGYDQGELMVQALLGQRFYWIAPSRFGYLRSSFHDGATFDDQAHAYAYLLDQLGVKMAAVVALSHGGPSALLFAVLHPERVSSLTLISAGVASSTGQNQTRANEKGDALVTIFKYDLLYWGITKLFKRRLMKLMGANRAVIDGLTPEQRELVGQIINYMNPVSLRYAGVAFDNKALLPNERISAIRVPTLIFHAKDDTLQLYQNAEFAASNIPGARLVRFERGGHLLICVEQTTIRTIMQKYIVDHTSE